MHTIMTTPSPTGYLPTVPSAQPRTTLPAGTASPRALTLQGTTESRPPADYAKEVGDLVRAARTPTAIGSGLAIGASAGYGVHRMRRATGHDGIVLPIASGILAATLGHGLISWAIYKRRSSALSDQGTDLIARTQAGQQQAAAASRELLDTVAGHVRASYHPLAMGVGLGVSVAGTYGLYRWRNPPGSQKQRWVLPLLGGMVGGSAAHGITASIIARQQRASLDASGLSDVLDFSSVTSTIMTAATIVCLYGGGKYLYDTTWRRRRGDSGRTGSSKQAPTLRDRPRAGSQASGASMHVVP